MYDIEQRVLVPMGRTACEANSSVKLRQILEKPLTITGFSVTSSLRPMKVTCWINGIAQNLVLCQSSFLMFDLKIPFQATAGTVIEIEFVNDEPKDGRIAALLCGKKVAKAA